MSESEYPCKQSNIGADTLLAQCQPSFTLSLPSSPMKMESDTEFEQSSSENMKEESKANLPDLEDNLTASYPEITQESSQKKPELEEFLFEDPTYANEKEECCGKDENTDYNDEMSTLDGQSERDQEAFEKEFLPHPAGVDIEMDLEFQL